MKSERDEGDQRRHGLGGGFEGHTCCQSVTECGSEHNGATGDGWDASELAALASSSPSPHGRRLALSPLLPSLPHPHLHTHRHGCPSHPRSLVSPTPSLVASQPPHPVPFAPPFAPLLRSTCSPSRLLLQRALSLAGRLFFSRARPSPRTPAPPSRSPTSRCAPSSSSPFPSLTNLTSHLPPPPAHAVRRRGQGLGSLGRHHEVPRV